MEPPEYILLVMHPPLRWLGNAAAWRVTSTAVLIGFITLLWFLRWKGQNYSAKGWQWWIFIAGMAAFATFFMGGNTRERAKNPHAVYKQLEKPEALPYEIDRFLVYDTCLGCHVSPEDFKLSPGKDWAQRVAFEREQGHIGINDEEAGRIVNYLKEYHE